MAIVSLGWPRRLHLRPTHGGGRTRTFALGGGDLLVMGGSCQRTWQHAVPKTARPVGPRVSVQFRPQASADGPAISLAPDRIGGNRPSAHDAATVVGAHEPHDDR